MLAGLPPLLLRPHYVPKPWGGERLARELGRTDAPAGPVGESWEVFDLGGDEPSCSVIDGGPHDGRTLRDVLGEPFPLLLKVLDAREPLSVQLHPDGRDEAPAKEEAWIALAEGGAVALARSGQDLSGVEGDWLSHLERVPLAAGAGERAPTLVHVPPGTVHAILGGSLLFEVQNNVDITWRLDDHGRVDSDGRPRELHVEQASEVLARGTPVRSAVDPGGTRLVGDRFTLELLPPGDRINPAAHAVFFTSPGEVTWGAGETFEVPGARTVLLPPEATGLAADGWMIAAASL